MAQGPVAAREALAVLRTFLKPRNAQALASLEEAGERLIALQLLDGPSTLNISPLSTNLIENAVHNYRRETKRGGGGAENQRTRGSDLLARPGSAQLPRAVAAAEITIDSNTATI